MTVKMFNDQTKKAMVEHYIDGVLTIEQMAKQISCSVTTIKRVLEEAEVFKPKKRKNTSSFEQKQIMAICYRHKIDSQKLEMLINEPSLTPDNVVAFLRNSNARQLAIILLAAGLATQLPTFPIPKDAQMRLIE